MCSAEPEIALGEAGVLRWARSGSARGEAEIALGEAEVYELDLSFAQGSP